MSRSLLIFAKLALAVATGVLLRFVLDLHPVWWLVWIVPALPLLIAIRFKPREARWMVAPAVVIGASCNFHYYRLVMPLFAVILVIGLQSWLWIFLIFATRRVIVRYQSWWTVLVYPVLWVAVDSLCAALLPDGNWGSLAYSQGDNLPVLQIASLFGVSGVLFLVTLVPSTVAVAVAYGRSLRRGWIAYALTSLLLVASLAYGYARLHQPVTGAATTFGIVSIDNPIGPHASAAYASNIRSGYDSLVRSLASQGAQIVVLPEKIAVLVPANVSNWQQHFSALALQNRVWLEVGIGIDDGRSPTNWAWLFTPQGDLVSSYEKHHMAPPERRDHYVSGTEYNVLTVEGQTYGLAICKDMHFAAFGREYGLRHAAVMLVPAWDFAYLDGWLEARTTVFRGVENGYSIVRASREGLLTASDPYGRILAEMPSSELPGRSLLATITVTGPVSTLYTCIGNLFGWLCVAAAALFLVLGRTQQHKSSPVPRKA
ncbi:MAG: nitrilase-related carbon-nitrogen hydrolase [Terracidiphilus sp.]|nr:nitrilase-related carbon-nitrogen hydrolase [Terracidiphilus sp.]